MCFSGSPGTAKTTVARLFAGIMRDNGLLSSGHLVEVGRGDLVGKYTGWTAQTVSAKFREAAGGVLFIDEAYSLVDDREGSYGDEAIHTIVQEMENQRSDTVVILAGYNDKMEELLGIRPDNDADGILQDTHWSDGSFGYFPTYALGNIFDGMFLEMLTEELGDVDTLLADGRIKEITAWLHEKIHKFGSLRNGREVVEYVCGKEVSAKPILKYFEEKYTKLYKL